MGFKEDADFARFVSMGAIGSAVVASHLRSQLGHQPIELERYAMANKVWQTKVKRLRLPDLLCVRCGLRIESRAKSKLAVVLSHSNVAGREWDAGGMRDQDLYAFLRVINSDSTQHMSKPSYFSTEALRAAIHKAKRSNPKASSEGSEVTLQWPCWIPNKNGTFIEVDDDGFIVCRWTNGRTYRYWQWRNWNEPRFIYLQSGAAITAGETIVAGVVQPFSPSPCSDNTWDLAKALNAEDKVDRYAAIKAAGHRSRVDLMPTVAEIADNSDEDWRMRLEALAVLSRLEPSSWVSRVESFARSGIPEQQMEAVFILSEISGKESGTALAKFASDTSIPAELRAAAAWGLGQGATPRPDLLISITHDKDDYVALHAIAAIDHLPEEIVSTLEGWLPGPDNRRAAVAAQLLQRHHQVDVLLNACGGGKSARLWALRALGDMPPQLVRDMGGDKLTPDAVESLEPMWQGQNDWLRTTGREGLDALDAQKVRFDPANPVL